MYVTSIYGDFFKTLSYKRHYGFYVLTYAYFSKDIMTEIPYLQIFQLYEFVVV